MLNDLSSALPSLVAPVPDAGHALYLERVYAGVLGKLIGVYLGRPVENWSYERIREEFGQVEYYIHEERGRRLIVTDDDISGTFTFLRALEDYGFDPELTAAQIGQTWLNYLIERTTILWWGGMGNSTEHTAYLRLKQGVAAPASGSCELNSQIVAEQIGGQIFIDGWGLVSPGNAAQAASLARRAASVSHDGEAIYGAQVIAVLVAHAFVETNIDRLLDEALRHIPADCTIRKLIDDLREWHAAEPDWRENRMRLAAEYGYDRFVGNCHIVPNHGLIILSLLHGAGDFDRSMAIVNTCGWDTDCNSGNLGAILGVRNGLSGLSGRDWRGPVADRLYLPSADGGRAITDAATEAIRVANAGRALIGLDPIAPKAGRRFHFALPGSVQGWRRGPDAERGYVRNAVQQASEMPGALLVRSLPGARPIRATTPTFIPPDTKDMVTGYVLVANPTLYSGHLLKIRIQANGEPASGRLVLSHYDREDESISVAGPEFHLRPGDVRELDWRIPDTGGYPIHEVGLELDRGEIYVDWVDWNGVPRTSWPPVEGTMWARAWAKSLDRWEYKRDAYEFLTHSEGIGLLTQGAREWRDYRLSVRLTPRMAVSGGVAIRVQGLRRYYAFVFGDRGEVRIDKALDGRRTLVSGKFDWEPFRDYQVVIEAEGDTIRASIDGQWILSVTDRDRPLTEGAGGFVVEAGCLGAGTPGVSPL
ncbi:ADP-ribosylglycohydrolase family protein [Fimbriimonas ginsengisoli]|uniref:Large exoproteins involved in heme utilization or adhesion n=1 Tax=Fimbriimonas ginsengisoli Gsoil 348 TaxID=661478 RepID=A0A068NLV5_FIMGI|nr:ADP-ribosylglycohydrolase family protein [Fimbriimonas ginsengisoli]AIE83755.1 Large exoproteins involved in heme utilization or adhesion [Fimbriimonas ginsengisoli Gsoil 348]